MGSSDGSWMKRVTPSGAVRHDGFCKRRAHGEQLERQPLECGPGSMPARGAERKHRFLSEHNGGSRVAPVATPAGLGYPLTMIPTSSASPLCWAISDGAAGNERQALALARAL